MTTSTTPMRAIAAARTAVLWGRSIYSLPWDGDRKPRTVAEIVRAVTTLRGSLAWAPASSGPGPTLQYLTEPVTGEDVEEFSLRLD